MRFFEWNLHRSTNAITIVEYDEMKDESTTLHTIESSSYDEQPDIYVEKWVKANAQTPYGIWDDCECEWVEYV